MTPGSIIDDYLAYTDESEPPKVFHRWSMLVSVGALLGRNFYMRHGHFNVFPNVYVMLIGGTGSRKSSAIKMAQRVVAASGYDTFAKKKTSKEKFLCDLAGIDTDLMNGQSNRGLKLADVTSENLWGKEHKEPAEMFIVADEFNEFAGVNNMDFYSMLGDMWDWDMPELLYESGVKNSKSPAIYQPTINLLGGNTTENFSRCFPPEILGQGFLTRLLLIHGARSGKRYTFPPIPADDATASIVRSLQLVRSKAMGEAAVEPDAASILDTIYKGWEDIDDIRFANYSTRRFTHLLKLCLIVAATRCERSISVSVVTEANTVLFAAESNFVKALGEFGKSRFSDTTNKIVAILEKTHRPLTARDLWKEVSKDLDKPEQLQEILSNLKMAERVQSTEKGLLLRRTKQKSPQFIDLAFLTDEERGML